jgi:hypothetical protein
VRDRAGRTLFHRSSPSFSHTFAPTLALSPSPRHSLTLPALVPSPDIWKADVIGDCYMLVSNLSGNVENSVDQVIDVAIAMQSVTREVRGGQE